MAARPAPYVGTVKSFNPSKGWGFIECQDTMHRFGSDVFLLKNELQGFGVAKGDQISFTVNQSGKGIQATNVKVLSNGSGGNQSFYGEIKSYNPQRGFGFISGPATESIFKKDVFVMKSEFPGGVLPQGAQVQFKAKMGERGPVATEVQLLGMGMAMQQWTGGWPQWGGMQNWAPMHAWTGAQQWGAWGNAPQKAPSENEIFFGTLKQINAEKGWGHITCEAMQKMYGKDMFVMKSSLENVAVQPGQPVVFTVTQGPKGPHAINIRPFTGQVPEQVFTGKVKSYNESKGWGFIESPTAKQVYQTDIFLHKRELDGKTLAAGDQIQFTVDIASGRAAAKNVDGASNVPNAAPRATPY